LHHHWRDFCFLVLNFDHAGDQQHQQQPMQHDGDGGGNTGTLDRHG
jgi:hypothetical protein